MSNREHLKLVVVGDGAVGKSCLLISWASGSFPREYVPTVFDNYSSNVNINGKMVSLGLWDTAGQEDYDSLRPLSYAGTDIFFVCFSVVNRISFENISSKWIPEVRKYSPESQFILVGTKTDLRINNNNEHVKTEEGQKLAKFLKMYAYCETSSLQNVGLKECFDTAFRSTTFDKKKSSGGGWGIFSSLFGGSKSENSKNSKPVPPVMPEAGRSPWSNVDASEYIPDIQKLLKSQNDDFDVTIVTIDELGKDKVTQFEAHRIMLAVGSTIFDKIFKKYQYSITEEAEKEEKSVEFENNGFIKCLNIKEKTIYINSEIPSEMFKFLLEFLYIGNFVTPPNPDQIKKLRKILHLLEEDPKLKDDISKILTNLEESSKQKQQEEKEFFKAINLSLQSFVVDERAKNFKEYYNNPIFSDVSFSVGGKKIFLHKCLLFCRSEYFKTMLTSNFIESKQKEVEILESEEFHQEFLYFLQFLYTSHTYDFINNENALKMLSLGNKFGNHRLITFCEIYVSKLVERECSDKIEKSGIDVIGILLFSDHHEAEQLKNFCLHFVASNYQCFKRRKEWNDLKDEKELFDYVEKNQWPPKSYLLDVKNYQKKLDEYYKKMGKKIPKKEINFLKKDILKDIEKYELNEEDGEEETEGENDKVQTKKVGESIEKEKKKWNFFGIFG